MTNTNRELKESVPHAGIVAATPAAAPEAVPKTHDTASKLSHWIHQHPNATKNVVGYTVYQGIRGAIAGIPYGISMAGTLGAMVGLERLGGQLAKSEANTLAHSFGKRLEQFAKFPAVRSSTMIATSFTLYRGTSKLGKFVHDQMFDPKDSEEQTAEKIRHIGRDTIQRAKDNAPAGLASTPVAAFVLGSVGATFQKPAADKLVNDAGRSLDWTHGNYKAAKAAGKAEGKLLLKEVITHPNAKFVEQAAINTLGYSLFFEMGDRLFKDRQIARGKWPGENYSIKPAKASPEIDDAKDGTQPIKVEEHRPAKGKYSFFTDEPSVGRFIFRRMLPTAVSITAYTAFKFRHAYMHLGDLAVKPGKILPQIPGLAKTEITAVLWFAMIPYVAEKWEKLYDGFFDKLEHKHNPDANSPITPTLASHAPSHGKPVNGKVHEIPGTPTVHVAEAVNEGKAAPQLAAVAV